MRIRPIHATYILLVLLAVASFVVWSRALAQPESELSVSFLDVGQGDAILIEAPDGGRVLIDGGKGRAVLEALGDVLPLGDRRIDAVIATHPDFDHIGGLPDIFARYDIGMFIESGVKDDGADSEALHEAVENEGLPAERVRAGMHLMVGGGAYLEFLFPDRELVSVDANVGSIVLRLVYGDTSMLLTGDSPALIEEYLVDRYGEALRSDVLKLGHHGSKTSSAGRFLNTVAPRFAVLSYGCDNTYGHPHAEVLERLSRLGITSLHTCTEGTITFVSDGHSVVPAP